MRKLFTLVALLSAMVLPTQAEVVNGTCENTDLIWSYDNVTKRLTFGLNGTRANIPNYSLNETPWNDYKNEVEHLDLPDGLTGIGTYAFHSFKALKDVRVPESLTYIEQYSFQGCRALEEFRMSEGVTMIGSHAFSECYSLTTLAVPNSATDLKYQAFDRVPNVSYADGRTKDYGARCVNGHVEGAMVYTNESKAALAACSAVLRGEIVVDPEVRTICERAFTNCYQMTSVVFGDAVTLIDNYALEDCDAVESITLGSGIVTLNRYSLECENVKRVYSKALVPPIDISSYTFYGARLSEAVLYVPAESVAAYQTADVWKEFGSILADTQGIGEVTGERTKGEWKKVVRNGQLFILRDGKTYNAIGTEVR